MASTSFYAIQSIKVKLSSPKWKTLDFPMNFFPNYNCSAFFVLFAFGFESNKREWFHFFLFARLCQMLSSYVIYWPNCMAILNGTFTISFVAHAPTKARSILECVSGFCLRELAVFFEFCHSDVIFICLFSSCCFVSVAWHHMCANAFTYGWILWYSNWYFNKSRRQHG